jgi:hypothetical protein
MDATDERTERNQVEDWREHVLIEAGYPADDAIELSRRHDVDLHRAVELLLAGCDVAVAVDILR